MDVTEQTWQQEVLDASAEAPVVVDFWAEWCGPCKALGPVLEAAAEERGIRLAKLDVDSNQQLAQQFDVRGIPAVKAFRNGHVVSEFVGAQPRVAVEAFLDGLIKPSVAESVDDPELAAALGTGYEAALELLLARIDADPAQRDASRELMVSLFGELGHEHPTTVRYRRRLATAIY